MLGFMAPLVVVKRKSDSPKGSLYFQHSPRYYYGFEPGLTGWRGSSVWPEEPIAAGIIPKQPCWNRP